MTEPTLEPTGPGALLRAAREKQGLHIAALAAAIKVSPRKLDALENDRWNELPDATFTRALAQTVCRTLKVDPRPILEKLPAAAPVVLETHDSGLNAPFHDRPGREDPGAALAAVRPMIWAAAVLMVAAVLVYLLPADWLQRKAAPAATPAVAAASAALAASTATSASAAASATLSAEAASAPLVAASVMAPIFMPGPASAPMGTAEGFVPPPVAPAASAPAAAAPPVAAKPAPAPVLAAPTPAAAPAASLVQLKTTQASWVEARDSRGNTLLSRIVQPGEALGLEGALPIRLTIGNAAATQVGFRGQPVDLAPRTRDNVARVELQ